RSPARSAGNHDALERLEEPSTCSHVSRRNETNQEKRGEKEVVVAERPFSEQERESVCDERRGGNRRPFTPRGDDGERAPEEGQSDSPRWRHHPAERVREIRR